MFVQPRAFVSTSVVSAGVVAGERDDSHLYKFMVAALKVIEV